MALLQVRTAAREIWRLGIRPMVSQNSRNAEMGFLKEMGCLKPAYRHRSMVMGIESVNGVFQVHSKRFVGTDVFAPSRSDAVRNRSRSASACRVGIGQGVARHRTAKAQVIELGGLRNFLKPFSNLFILSH